MADCGDIKYGIDSVSGNISILTVTRVFYKSSLTPQVTTAGADKEVTYCSHHLLRFRPRGMLQAVLRNTGGNSWFCQDSQGWHSSRQRSPAWSLYHWISESLIGPKGSGDQDTNPSLVKTQMMSSDCSQGIMWSGYWPLIGQEWSCNPLHHYKSQPWLLTWQSQTGLLSYSLSVQLPGKKRTFEKITVEQKWLGRHFFKKPLCPMRWCSDRHRVTPWSLGSGPRKLASSVVDLDISVTDHT